MNALATHRRSILVSIVLALTAFIAFAPSASAQVDPTWDHYKVYLLNPPYPFPSAIPVQLKDQFGSGNDYVETLERFANPTEKMLDDGTVSPIHDPRLHYSWWLLAPQPFTGLVSGSNQFGDQVFNLGAGHYLWNPALKDEPGDPPLANHYKCYDCDGIPINRVVTMTDQFGQWQAMVTVPKLFCNPAEKTDPTGRVYPIVEPRQHYVCYEFQDFDIRTFTAFMTDQFVTDFGMALGPSDLLCVPTEKVEPTPTGQDTWGRLKVIYR